jgi:predicted ester cyclase
MSSRDNKALVVRYYEEFYGKKRTRALDDVFSTGYIHHIPDVASGTLDFKEFKKRELNFLEAFHDLERTIDEVITEKDRVVVRSTMKGKQTGDLPNIPASKKKVEVTSIVIYHIRDGKVVEGWENYDSLGMMMELEVVNMRSTLSKRAHDKGHIQHLSQWPI